MGKRDRPGREIKKVKKQPLKSVQLDSDLTVTSTSVEVVRRKKKREETADDE